MAEGRPNHAIAERLVITGRSVEKHVLPPTPEHHGRVLAVLSFLSLR
jgi:hypothetical protein